MSGATTDRARIDPAGLGAVVITDMPADDYHADPVDGGSLTSSGARALLPPSCPARYHYDRNQQTRSDVFDFGHAAHRLVLGAGPGIEVIDADSWRTKTAREQRDQAYADGRTPLLAADYDQVEAMAQALTDHKLAKGLLTRGAPEQTIVWRDDHSPAVVRRARLDWLPESHRGRVVIPDYKTCHSAHPDSVARSAYQFGYHQQADWYLAAARAADVAGDDAAFVFICQEKQPPYLVSVVELDHVAMQIGAARNRRAIQLYDHCTKAGQWPAYVDGIAYVSLPRWAEIEEGEHA